MTDYWSSEYGLIVDKPTIQFAIAGDTSVVAYTGVKSYGTDTDSQLVVCIATKNAGWGVSLKTVATTGDPCSILVRGIVKMTVGYSTMSGAGTPGGGSTRNYAQSFGSAGLLADMGASYTPGPTAFKCAVALQGGGSNAGDSIIYLIG